MSGATLVAVVVAGLVGLALGAILVDWRRRRRDRALADELASVRAELDAARQQLADVGPWRRDLVTSLAMPAVVFDGEGQLAAANDRARRLLGIVSRDTPVTAIQALGSAVLADAVARVRREQQTLEVEAEVGDRHVSASVSPVGEDTLVIVHDRTREKRIEELRRNFVVNASHELKTPAASIQTLSEAMEVTATRDPGRVPDLVGRLREESDRLVRLVHDLLSLRRLEEREDLDLVDVDVVAVVTDVIAGLDDRAREADVTLSLDAPESAWLQAEADDVRLVVRNLVANGIQYNRAGGRVDLSVTPVDDGWEVAVADTGIGIPQQDLQRIFERFYRVDVARSRETGGTGLGLSIVRHAVERHGGTIRVDSLLGEGTTFRVHLPRVPDQH